MPFSAKRARTGDGEIEQRFALGDVRHEALNPADSGETRAFGDGRDVVDGAGGIKNGVTGIELQALLAKR
jgi:hypothetical protein